VAVAEPAEILLPSETPTLRRIEIIDASRGNRVVTMIELLSPTNKVDKLGRTKYRKKQAEYIQAGVSLVEIDLLRAGPFVLAMPEACWPRRMRATYKICIRRLTRPHVSGVIAIRLQDRLPNIPVPLRPKETDVVLQLQPIIDDCYLDGRYGSIDYREPSVPPLNQSNAQWVDELLHREGRR
jgi:hypothetical protein